MSGAEQLKISGDRGAAHGLAAARNRDWSASRLPWDGRNRFQRPSARALALQLLQHRRPVVAMAVPDLLLIEVFGGIDVPGHESRQPSLQLESPWRCARNPSVRSFFAGRVRRTRRSGAPSCVEWLMGRSGASIGAARLEKRYRCGRRTGVPDWASINVKGTAHDHALSLRRGALVSAALDARRTAASLRAEDAAVSAARPRERYLAINPLGTIPLMVDGEPA